MDLGAIDLASIILTVCASAAYAIVAVMLSRRPVSADATPAKAGFIVWWAGLAMLGVYGLVFSPRWGIDLASKGIHILVPVVYFVIGAIYIMLGGLMYYMLYLYTGRRASAWIPIAYIAIMTGALVWLMHGFGALCMYPDDAGCQQPAGWSEDDGARLSSMEVRPDWVAPVWGLALVVPPLASTAMYALLWLRVRDATSKWRIATVSGGLILWFGFSAAGSVAALGGADTGSPWRQLASQSLGLLSAVLVLMAYSPPSFARRRWGVQKLDQGEARA